MSGGDSFPASPVTVPASAEPLPASPVTVPASAKPLPASPVTVPASPVTVPASAEPLPASPVTVPASAEPFPVSPVTEPASLFEEFTMPSDFVISEKIPDSASGRPCPACIEGRNSLPYEEWAAKHLNRPGPANGSCGPNREKFVFFGNPDKCCCLLL